VNFLCFWGPRPTARWKRRALVVCALLFLLGIPALFFTLPDRYINWYNGLLSLPFFLMGALGFVVALVGCDECVARALGEA
jgi:hypothetical protein